MYVLSRGFARLRLAATRVCMAYSTASLRDPHHVETPLSVEGEGVTTTERRPYYSTGSQWSASDNNRRLSLPLPQARRTPNLSALSISLHGRLLVLRDISETSAESAKRLSLEKSTSQVPRR